MHRSLRSLVFGEDLDQGTCKGRQIGPLRRERLVRAGKTARLAIKLHRLNQESTAQTPADLLIAPHAFLRFASREQGDRMATRKGKPNLLLPALGWLYVLMCYESINSEVKERLF